MKKTYKIDVDCANCANKMEDAAKNTAGVKDATVNFMTLKMSVEFEEGRDAKAVMQEVLKLPGAGMTNDIISMPAL
jgi:copper chaperone CopZ